MKRAMEHLQDLSQDEEVRRWEEAREKFIRDQRAEKAYAFDEGLEKGLQKGRAEGLQKVALNMIQKKWDVAIISEVTGLSEKMIKNLQEKLEL